MLAIIITVLAGATVADASVFLFSPLGAVPICRLRRHVKLTDKYSTPDSNAALRPVNHATMLVVNV